MREVSAYKGITLEQLAELMMQGFARVDRRLDALENRFTLLEERVGALEKRMDLLENRFSILEQRVDSIQLQINDLGDIVTRGFNYCDEQFRLINKRLDRMVTKVEFRALVARVDDIEDRV